MEIQRILALQYSGYTLLACTLYLLGHCQRQKGSSVGFSNSVFAWFRFRIHVPQSRPKASEAEAPSQ
jgi:hypothetical protein